MTKNVDLCYVLSTYRIQGVMAAFSLHIFNASTRAVSPKPDNSRRLELEEVKRWLQKCLFLYAAEKNT